MSKYADYLTERTNDQIIEGAHGFVTYRYINEGKTVYIIDIYTDPKERRTGYGTTLADQVIVEAKEKGCTELLGTVVPSTKNSTSSLQALLAYDMKLYRSSDDLVIFRKDI